MKLPHKPGWVLLLRAEQGAAGRQAFAAYLLHEKARHMLDQFLPPLEPGLPEDINLIARPPRNIEAVVLDSQKQPVADATVFLQATWDDTIGEAKTDAEGKTTLRFPADAPLASIVAMKSGVGLDYFLYQSLLAETPDRHRLAADHAGPLTFALKGSRRITINVVDEIGQPLPGATVFAWHFEKPGKGSARRPNANQSDGGALLASGIEAFGVTSDAQGRALFDFLPADGGGISFQASAPGRAQLEPAFVHAGDAGTGATLTTFRTLPISGQVTLADGRPASDATIFVLQQALDDGRDSGPKGLHSFTGFTNEQGRFRFRVFPNQFILLRASQNQWAAPLATCIVLDEPPERPVQIVLQKATRVHGRLSAGPGRRLIPRQQVSVRRRVDDAYRALRDRGLALKPDARRGRAAPASGIQVLYHASANTNADGEFEIFLGPGKYQLRYGEQTADIELNGEAEHEVNIHAEQPTHVELVGRVVFEGSEQRGVANAWLTGYYLSYSEPVASVTNTKGVFRFARRPVEMLLYARDEDGLFAQIVSVAADQQAAIISLGQAASVHGRLIDAATGDPGRNASVAYGVLWEDATTHREYRECGGTVQTDERGEFVATGLVPGRKYRLTLHSSGARDRLATVGPRGADNIELGDYRVNLSGKAAKSATGPVAPSDAPRIFKFASDGKSRLAAAQQRAKTENKRVLLVLGAEWSAWCHRLDDLFHNNDDIAAALRENFVVVLVNVDDSGPENRDAYVAQYAFLESRLPRLVVLDGSGIRLDSAISQNLEEDDHYNVQKVLEFLDSWKRGRRVSRRAEAVPAFRRGPRAAPKNK